MSYFLRKNSNDALLHMYYPVQKSSLYKIDVMYHWYEILSEYLLTYNLFKLVHKTEYSGSFGGLFGITMGLSLISVVEVILFLSYKWISYSKEGG